MDASEVTQYPGLVQWLALADEKQDTDIVAVCLGQLVDDQADTHDAAMQPVCNALSSYCLRPLIDGLRSETKTDIMCMMAGIPPRWKVTVRLHSFFL
jgi:hypothetical protein